MPRIFPLFITRIRSAFCTVESLFAIVNVVPLPASCEALNPVAIIAWLSDFLAGQFIHRGVASLNAVFVSGMLYFGVMKLLAISENRPTKYFAVATMGSRANPSAQKRLMARGSDAFWLRRG